MNLKNFLEKNRIILVFAPGYPSCVTSKFGPAVWPDIDKTIYILMSRELLYIDKVLPHLIWWLMSDSKINTVWIK